VLMGSANSSAPRAAIRHPPIQAIASARGYPRCPSLIENPFSRSESVQEEAYDLLRVPGLIRSDDSAAASEAALESRR